MPRRFKVVSVNRVNNCCLNYGTTHGPESKLLQTSNREQSKALNPVYIRIAFPFFVEYNQSENQFKENLKTSNREDKNDLESFLRPVDKKSRPKALDLEERPIFSLHKKCRFLAAANAIRMRSRGTREHNCN